MEVHPLENMREKVIHEDLVDMEDMKEDQGDHLHPHLEGMIIPLEEEVDFQKEGTDLPLHPIARVMRRKIKEESSWG